MCKIYKRTNSGQTSIKVTSMLYLDNKNVRLSDSWCCSVNNYSKKKIKIPSKGNRFRSLQCNLNKPCDSGNGAADSHNPISLMQCTARSRFSADTEAVVKVRGVSGGLDPPASSTDPLLKDETHLLQVQTPDPAASNADPPVIRGLTWQ